MEYINKTINNIKSSANSREIKNITSKEGKYVYFTGKKMLNLSSNDYLSVANNLELRKEFMDTMGFKYGFGSAASRLLSGNENIYFELESKLASLFKKEACLLFNSGYQANLGIVSSLVSNDDAIFVDEIVHASIVDGCKLSEARFFTYNHLDYDNLEILLKNERSKYKCSLIITESLFGLNGDFADLERLIYLKNKYNCFLMVDESHSFGVYGKKQLGYCEQQNFIEDTDLIISGLGKATGSCGAFCVSSKNAIDLIINRARTLMSSTAIAPINVAWSKFIIDKYANSLKVEADKLFDLVFNFSSILSKSKIVTTGTSYIVPIIISEDNINKYENIFLENNIFITSIKYPTVPLGKSRFRISLNSSISSIDLEKAIEIFSGNI